MSLLESAHWEPLRVNLERALLAYEANPTQDLWDEASAAYSLTLNGLTADERDVLWAKVKAYQAARRRGDAAAASSPWAAWDGYRRARARRWAASEAGQALRRQIDRARDQRRSQEPRRQEQLRAARARYRAKTAPERQILRDILAAVDRDHPTHRHGRKEGSDA
jgi:hypothetical protein